jgi:antitoxin (DNA-binding transcriptional repressor) of toxin-antitoxin stability system
LAALCVPLAVPLLLAQAPASPKPTAQVSVRSVKVLGSKDAVEIEVDASDRIVPQTQVLTGPDRLVIDFPNAVPSNQLRSQSIDRGEVKDVRVGLFQSKPAVTRIVLDLKSAQSYQVFPYGRTVIIKVMGGSADTSASMGNFSSSPTTTKRPGLVVANYVRGAEPVSVVTAAQSPLEVTYLNGLLGIRANKATLSEVLFAVQQRTGAEVSIAAGAELEKVVADIAPAPAPEVLARLLNGSKFNFLILSGVDDPTKLDRVILSPRPEGGYVPPPLSPVQADDRSDQEPASMNLQPGNRALAPAPVPQPPDGKAPADENTTPDQ